MVSIWNSASLVKASDKGSLRRAVNQYMPHKLVSVSGNDAVYHVRSSGSLKYYEVRVRMMDLDLSNIDDGVVSDAITGRLKVHCSCPAFLYWGWQYISDKLGAGIIPERRPPNIRNPKRKGMCCKHLIVVLKDIHKDRRKLTGLFKKANR